MTTWTVVDDSEGVQVSISDAGRNRLANEQQNEQRLTRLDRLYVEIKLGALGGAVITLAALVIKQLLGI